MGMGGRDGCLLRRSPGREQPESFGGGRAGLGRVDEQDEAGLGGDGELLVGEGELTHDRVLEPLRAGAVGADVVVGPEAAEGFALGGEFAYQVLEGAVVGVSAGFGSHDVDAHLGEEVPVGVEVPRGGVEELEACEVRRTTSGLLVVADDGRVERPAEGVGRQQVLVRVADEGDAVGDGLERPLQAESRRGLRRRTTTRTAAGGDAVRSTCEVVQVGALGLVELQRPRQRLQDAGRGAGDLPTLETGVVLHAQAGQRRDLAAAQSLHAAAAGGRQPDLLRGDAGAAGGEELAHVVSVVHDVETRPVQSRPVAMKGALSVHPSTGTPTPVRKRVHSMSRRHEHAATPQHEPRTTKRSPAPCAR